MSTMKSIADKLRDKMNDPPLTAVKKEAPVQQEKIENLQNKDQHTKRKEETKETNPKIQKPRSVKSGQDISQLINALSFDSETKEPKQVPIRFPSSIYKRLRLLGEEASIQKITVYAVNQLMESEEIKEKLKNILKSLNE